jgi:hypothetical protein
MDPFQALSTGSVKEFKLAIGVDDSKKSSRWLSELTNPLKTETLIRAAINISNPTLEQKECIISLIKKLGNDLILVGPLKQEQAVERRDTFDPLVEAVKASNLDMVKILFPLYCQGENSLVDFWGKGKAALAKDSIRNAISEIKQDETDLMIPIFESHLDQQSDVDPAFSKEIFALIYKKEFVSSFVNDTSCPLFDDEGVNSAALVSACRENNLVDVGKVLGNGNPVKMGGVSKAARLLGNKAVSDSDYATSLSILDLLENVEFKDKDTLTPEPNKTLPVIITEQREKIETARAKKEAALKAAVTQAISSGSWGNELNALKIFYVNGAQNISEAHTKYQKAKDDLGLSLDGKSLKNQEQSPLLKAFRANDRAAVKEKFSQPESLDKVNQDELKTCIAKVGDDTEKTADNLAASIAILEYLYSLYAPALGSKNAAHPEISHAISTKIRSLKIEQQNNLVENIQDAIQQEDKLKLEINFKKLKKYFLVDIELEPNTEPPASYKINMDRFVPFVQNLGLDANGNILLKKPASVSTVASSSSSASTSQSVSIIGNPFYQEVNKCRGKVEAAFVNNNTTEEEFARLLAEHSNGVKAVVANVSSHPDPSDLAVAKEVSRSLETFKSGGRLLLAHACIHGLARYEVDGDTLVNPGGVNVAVLQAFAVKLTDEHKLAVFTSFENNNNDTIHSSMVEYVDAEIKRIQEKQVQAKKQTKHVTITEPADPLQTAKNELAILFVNPAASVEAFEDAYDALEAAVAANLAPKGANVDKDNVPAFIRAVLVGIKVPSGSKTLLEYVTREGLLSEDNLGGVNPEVYQKYLTLAGMANVQSVLPDIMGVSQDQGAERVKYIAVPSESNIEPENANGNSADKDLRAIYQHIVDAVTKDDKSISAANNSIRELREYYIGIGSSNPEAAFVSGLKNLTVLPSNKSVLLLAIELPDNAIDASKRNAVVARFHHYLGAEITEGKIENDPLVIASKLGRAEVVETLLPFYADPAHWKDDEQRAAVLTCLEAAVAQLGSDCTTEPAKFLPVFEKFYKCPAFSGLKVPYRENHVFQDTVNQISTSIEQHLMTRFADLFEDPNASEIEYKAAVSDLKLYYTSIGRSPEGANTFFIEALLHGVKVPPGDGGKTVLAYAAEKGIASSKNPEGVNAAFFDHVLSNLYDAKAFDTLQSRQVLYDKFVSQPEAKSNIRKFFTQNPVEGASGLALGVELPVEDLKQYIVDLLLYPHATAVQFNAVCNELKTKLAAGNIAAKPDDLLSKALLDIRCGYNQTLLEYACDKGVHQTDNPDGVNPAVLSAYLQKHKDDAVRAALPTLVYQHESVQPHLVKYTNNAVITLKPTPTYKSRAISGAMWTAGFVTLGILGVLAEAFLFGEDRNMEQKLYSLANWCWRNPFGNSSELSTAGHFESHEAEMLSCVGAAMVIGASFIGALGGAGVHGVNQKLMSKPQK